MTRGKEKEEQKGKKGSECVTLKGGKVERAGE